MYELHIVAPSDGSIAVADKDVAFRAITTPRDRANAVRWSVETQPDAPGAQGLGSSFTFKWSATGVERVVARLDDQQLACDVVVYVFKTPGGGSTVADLLRSEPPPKRAAAFQRLGPNNVAPEKAS